MKIGDEVRIIDSKSKHNGRRAKLLVKAAAGAWVAEVTSGPNKGATYYFSEGLGKYQLLSETEPHSHYFKSWHGKIDVYRVCMLFEVGNPAITHAIKKLLCAGNRGGKSQVQDWQEAIDSIQRALDMAREDGLDEMQAITESEYNWDKGEQRMEQIGRNGNDGKHYGEDEGV